jgi:hypothetical protein
MENQTGYDLNAAVENWRRELAAQPGLTADERRELETHVRDAVADFQKRGLNDEESFWLACRRVGQPQQLGEEFAKADPTKVWRERAFWMVLGIFLISTLGPIPNTISMFVFNTFLRAGILRVFLNLALVIIVVLLASGKLKRPFGKLAELLGGRFRFASAAFILIFSSITLNYLGVVVFYMRINAGHSRTGILPLHVLVSYLGVFGDILRLLVLAFLLIWLLPKRNRKESQSA